MASHLDGTRERAAGSEGFKARLHELLEPSPSRDLPGKLLDGVLLSLIVLSVAAVILSTVEWVSGLYGWHLAVAQFAATGVFTVEYVLRLYAAPAASDGRYRRPFLGRLRFALTPMALIDLLAIAPFYLVFFFSGAELAGTTLLLRVLRLLKLFRYSRSLAVFVEVLRGKGGQLVASFFVTGVLLVLSSTVVYYSENRAQPEVFSSIPATM
ncbi:MAG: ion transporter [Rubrobacter sp.]|nr:ion transporter [Rubrobacter sp.]